MQTNKALRVLTIFVALVTLFSMFFVPSTSTSAAGNGPGKDLWKHVPGTPPPARPGTKPEVKPKKFNGNRLNRGGMVSLLATAPHENNGKATRDDSLVLSLPNPQGGFEDFSIQEAPVMEEGLAENHPEIKTYRGVGIDDPAATIRLDLTPLGFHASVRSPHGNWYIDPYYHLDDSLYASYYGRDLIENPHGTFVEGQSGTPEIFADQGYYHASDTVLLHGDGFAADALITVTILDPEGNFATRIVEAQTDANGSFDISFDADPDGNLGTHQIDASYGTDSAYGTYDVVTDEDMSVDPPVGDQLRTYRLALLTDPGYATYFGAANVTAAKVTLINRVTQVYEDDLSIRLVLIANNDLLNLNTAAQMTGTNGPCGGSACFSTSQAASCTSGTLTRNRQVIGLLVGASNFDIGHIAMGVNGGGLASLGVVGGNNKAQGCTGVTTPVGDLFAVDYVAHEMGHEFAGNHTFNGTVSNCSGGNRNGTTSVEPGSGSSIMAYAGICGTDDLQPHTDPYWSERSFDEIVTYTSAAETNINEVQMGVLTGFTVNGRSFQLRYNGNDSATIVRGTNFTTAGIQAAIQGIAGWPAGGTAAVSALSDTAFTITFTGTLANTNVSEFQLVSCTGGCSGYASEIAKGGATTRRGTVTPTGNNYPTVSTTATYTIPLRTPFTLAGSATDPDGDTVTYMWEQNDRGGSSGTGLISQPKANGPLFRQFGVAANVSATDTLLYDSPGENHVTTDPTRVFPDMTQILVNNTNAETGSCPAGNVDCFSEFLPTSAYVGFTGVNASPLSLHFRLTVRDGRGGVNNATTTLLLATNAGPFLVTAPNTAVMVQGGTPLIVTWNPANTNVSPVSTANVKIRLSVDGGYTYPYILAASTSNNGSATVTLPAVATATARIKVEATDNIFFDVSNSNFTITKANQAITFPAIADHTYLDPDFDPGATASSGLPVFFSASGNCTIASGLVHITGAGSCTVTASQPGNENYNAAPDVSRSFNIAKANQTISFPPITNRTYGDADFDPGATASSSLAVSYSASGNCSIASGKVNITGAGSCTVTASQAGNENYNPAPDISRTFSIAKAMLTVKPSPFTVSRQYSDPNPAFSPAITGYVNGENESALTTVPSCSTVSSTSAPGTYPITCTGGVATNYDFTNVNGTLTVTQEDADVTYAGDMLAFTASGGSTANVLLRATVLDSSLIASYADTAPGDIRNAIVTFKEGTTTLCGPLAVALINGATTTGTASCTKSLGLGAHTIDVYVNNYYTGRTSGVVEVAQPTGSFITGGGFLTIGKSGGTYPADTGSRTNFGFNVNYKNTKNLQGHVNIIFRAGGHTYQIKSTAIDSLGIAFKTSTGSACNGPASSTCFGVADFRSKANLTDTTNPLAPISLGGNLTLQVTITDKGEPGSSDTIAFTLWSGNKLVFSSEWNGSKTVEKILGGGNLVVH
jgi:hypothetical protein